MSLELARRNKVTLGLGVRVPSVMTLVGQVRQTTLDQLLHIHPSLCFPDFSRVLRRYSSRLPVSFQPLYESC